MGKRRIKSLTSSTRDAFVQTFLGLAALCRKLLTNGSCQYLLLGVFQTDLLEGEFGIYRQFNGGNFYIGVEQIISSAQFRRLQLYNRLNLTDADDSQPTVVHQQSPCCSEFTCSDSELDIMDLFLKTPKIFRWKRLLHCISWLDM